MGLTSLNPSGRCAYEWCRSFCWSVLSRGSLIGRPGNPLTKDLVTTVQSIQSDLIKSIEAPLFIPGNTSFNYPSSHQPVLLKTQSSDVRPLPLTQSPTRHPSSQLQTLSSRSIGQRQNTCISVSFQVADRPVIPFQSKEILPIDVSRL